MLVFSIAYCDMGKFLLNAISPNSLFQIFCVALQALFPVDLPTSLQCKEFTWKQGWEDIVENSIDDSCIHGNIAFSKLCQ